ncbi:fructose-bisphosphatase class III [Staphylococcus aureus]
MILQKFATEIIDLESILELPKGTEHFVSDLHGEYEALANTYYATVLGTCERKSMIFSKRDFQLRSLMT